MGKMWRVASGPAEAISQLMTEADTRNRTASADPPSNALGNGFGRAMAAMFMVLFLALTLAFGLVTSGRAAVVDTAGAWVVSEKVVDILSTELSQKIAEAEQAGKNVEAEFYKTLRQLVQELRVLLAEATKSMDEVAQKALRKTFSDLRALLNTTQEVTQERAIELMTIANSLNQTLSDVPGVTDRTVVTGVWPTTIIQRAQGEVQVLVLGVGLVDMKEVTLRVGDATLKPTTNLGNKLSFNLPQAVFAHQEKGLKTVQAEIVMNPGWLSRNVKVPVGFKVLPKQLAQVELRPTIAYLEREYSGPKGAQNQKLAAKNSRVSKSVKPTSAEWKIDVSSIKVRQTGGEKSSGWMFEGVPTEYGFSIAFDLDKVRRTGKSSKPGWALFDYSFREFRDVAATRDGKVQRLTLTSTIGAVALPAEDGMIAVGGTVKDYTGKTYFIVPSRTSYGWVQVEFVPAAKQVVVETDL